MQLHFSCKVILGIGVATLCVSWAPAQDVFGSKKAFLIQDDVPFPGELVDLDGDGDEELLFGYWTPGTIEVWEKKDGDPDFEKRALTTETVNLPRVADIHAGDIDGDGDKDLLLATGDSATFYERTHWIEMEGGVAVAEYLISESVGDALLLFEATGDEYAEAIAYGYGNQWGVYSSGVDGPTGSWERIRDLGPYQPTVADVTGDGIEDLIYIPLGPSDIVIYPGQGNPPQLSTEPITVDTPFDAAQWVSAADFNQDGLNEIVYWGIDNRLYGISQDGSGGFETPYVVSDTISLPLSVIGIGDINGDQQNDLILEQSENPPTVIVLLNSEESDIYFSNVQELSNDTPPVVPRPRYILAPSDNNPSPDVLLNVPGGIVIWPNATPGGGSADFALEDDSGDKILQPGETGKVEITIFSNFVAVPAGSTLEVQNSENLILTQTTFSLPEIGPDESHLVLLPFEVEDDGCGLSAGFELSINGDPLKFGRYFSYPIGISSTSFDLIEGSQNVPIPDATGELLTLQKEFQIRDREVSDVEVSLSIDHTYAGDLWVSLIRPDGEYIRLFVGEGANYGEDLNQTWSLDDLNGMQGDLTLTLEIVDKLPGDTGIVNDWSIEVASDGPRCDNTVADAIVEQLLHGVYTEPSNDENQDGVVDTADLVGFLP